ncbi:MAG: hypothetical protein WA967_14865, partial [Microbacterium sp.]
MAALRQAQEPRMLRRGLPRTKGGEAWPPATTIDVPGVTAVAPDAVTAASPAETTAPDAAGATLRRAQGPGVEVPGTGGEAQGTNGVAQAPADVPSTLPVAADASVTLRRGLPRVAGGDPWPPASAAPISSTARDVTESTEARREEAVQSAASGALAGAASGTATSVAPRDEVAPSAASDLPIASVAGGAADGAALRRGLP